MRKGKKKVIDVSVYSFCFYYCLTDLKDFTYNYDTQMCLDSSLNQHFIAQLLYVLTQSLCHLQQMNSTDFPSHRLVAIPWLKNPVISTIYP